MHKLGQMFLVSEDHNSSPAPLEVQGVVRPQPSESAKDLAILEVFKRPVFGGPDQRLSEPKCSDRLDRA